MLLGLHATAAQKVHGPARYTGVGASGRHPRPRRIGPPSNLSVSPPVSGPNQSGAVAPTSTVGDEIIKSGPIVHSIGSANVTGGGMLAGLPCGAPLSAH